jgi:hypothetical protein
MPRRRYPVGKQPLSPEALTALACSVVQRVDGFPQVYIEIAPIERDAAGRNWEVIVPAGLSSNSLVARVQEALAPWRDRFDVVA